MSKKVSRRKAEKTLAAVRKMFANDLDETGGNEMRLYEPGFHADCWVIAWEGWRGDIAWPIEVSEANYTGKIVLPDGVYVEAMNHWSVGVYPA